MLAKEIVHIPLFRSVRSYFSELVLLETDLLEPVKVKGRRKQVNLKAVELHLSLRQQPRSPLPAWKTRREQPDGGGPVVLSSSRMGGRGGIGGGCSAMLLKSPSPEALCCTSH